MTDWKLQLIKDFKAGMDRYELASKYKRKLSYELARMRIIEVENIIRDFMNENSK